MSKAENEKQFGIDYRNVKEAYPRYMYIWEEEIDNLCKVCDKRGIAPFSDAFMKLWNGYKGRIASRIEVESMKDNMDSMFKR